jgi:hypothetical protein
VAKIRAASFKIQSSNYFMSNEKHAEYLERKEKILGLENSISDKNWQVQETINRINEKKDMVTGIKAKLAIEDEAIKNPSRLRPPTMSAEQYLAHKSNAEMIESELPELNESLDFLNRSLSILKYDLNTERPALKAVKDLIAADLVGESLNELVAVASEPFKNLVVSIIAVKGKAQGYSIAEKELFKTKICMAVFEEILPKIFAGNALPDFHEANQYLAALIEDAA